MFRSSLPFTAWSPLLKAAPHARASDYGQPGNNGRELPVRTPANSGQPSKPGINEPKQTMESMALRTEWPWPKVSSMQALMRMANARRGPLWPRALTVEQQLRQNQAQSTVEGPRVLSSIGQATSALASAHAATTELATTTSDEHATTANDHTATARSVARSWWSLKRRLWPGGNQPLMKRRRWDLPRSEAAPGRSDTPVGDEAAISAVLDDTYTAASRKSVSARVDWWRRAAQKRGVAPFPLDQHKLTLAGALLNKASISRLHNTCTQLRKSMYDKGTQGLSNSQSN